MMIERPLTLVANALALALLVPEAIAALARPDHGFSVTAGFGIVLASIGAGMGGLLAAAHTVAWQRYAGFAAFGLIALGFSAAAAICGWRVDHAVLRGVALLAAAIPTLLWAAVIWRLRDGER